MASTDVAGLKLLELLLGTELIGLRVACQRDVLRCGEYQLLPW